MPLNTLRLNHAPSSHPNERIVFIKPLPRPPSQAIDYQTADTILRAIAAQCLPIMKNHYLSVTTLEEHEPNREFIGRNFNNGEVIQLVLRSRNGRWLPVNMIQMVMMHELAHNMHMNHGKKFWEARNLFAGEMRALWARGYTGEGFWGGGRTLSELGATMAWNVVGSEELQDLPLCGGTFRSRRRKRKAKSDGLTWREKKVRRIEKNFGKNGVALGEDEDKRLSLELSGKGPVGVKPRVAQSKRGRELRVAAALARFDTNKKEVEELDALKQEEEGTQSEDEFEDADAGQEDARDTDGQRMLDNKGQRMVKVCEEEDDDDVNVKREMEELGSLDWSSLLAEPARDDKLEPSDRAVLAAKSNGRARSLYDIPQHQDTPPQSPKAASPPPKSDVKPKAKPKITIHPSQPNTPKKSSPSSRRSPNTDEAVAPPPPASELPVLPSNNTSTSLPTVTKPTTITCPICSLTNQSQAPTCMACAHVLDRRKVPRSWKCTSEMCRDSEYVNAGDVGVCGICGERKSG